MKQCLRAVAGLLLGVCCAFAGDSKLDGIIRGKNGFQALINGQMVEVGDTVGAGNVRTIEAQRVAIEFSDGTIVHLRVGEKATAPAAQPAAAVTSPDLNRGVFASYPFNSNEGGRIRDVSSSHRDAAAENVAWTPVGKSGGALDFNGRDSFLTLPGPDAFNRLRAMTFSAWVYLRAMPFDFSGIVSRRMPSELWWFGVKNGQGLQLYMSGSGNAGDRTTGAGTLATGTWCHVVFTYEAGGSSAVYINSKPVNVVPVTGSLPGDEATPVRIGRGVGPSETFDGIIDEVLIYDRALTSEEIARLYVAGQ